MNTALSILIIVTTLVGNAYLAYRHVWYRWAIVAMIFAAFIASRIWS